MAEKQKFKIEETLDSFIIPDPVSSDGAYEVSKTLSSGSLEEHAERARQASSSDYQAATAPEAYEIANILFSQRFFKGSTIDTSTWNFFNKVFRGLFNTLSCVELTPKGKGRIIHRYGQKDQYIAKLNLAGCSGYILNSDFRATEFVQTILGTEASMMHIDEVFYWLNATKHTRLLKLDHRPMRDVKNAVVIGVEPDGEFVLSSNTDMAGQALMIRRIKLSERAENKVLIPMDDVLGYARTIFARALSDFEGRVRAYYKSKS